MPSIFFVRAGALQPSKKERTPHLSEKRLESSKRFDLSICQRTWLCLGVGSVQLRKGVDLFIDCAARFYAVTRTWRVVSCGSEVATIQIRICSIPPISPIRFVRAGLAQHAFILNETSNIDAAYKVR